MFLVKIKYPATLGMPNDMGRVATLTCETYYVREERGQEGPADDHVVLGLTTGTHTDEYPFIGLNSPIEAVISAGGQVVETVDNSRFR